MMTFQLTENKKTLRGFTLLEILIAIFIFTIISIIITQALHAALNTQSSTEKSAARMRDLQMTTLLISRDLEQIIDRPIINAERAQEASLIGSSQKIIFTHGGVTNPQGELLRSTLQRTQYSLLKEHLIRTTWEVLDQAPETKAQDRELMGSIQKLDFSYLDQEGHFSSSWPAANNTTPLPKAIRITLTISNWGTFSQLYLISGAALNALPA
ncbi:MAG: type II secretion system minor pseudopilin GspJ [Gammaproteobacteria bacterium]|nr:type II secretion system minor pseudopilin GspJ [Gammaproteobacteria bacterium]